MLDHNEAQGGVGRKVVKEYLQSFQSTGRCSDTNNKMVFRPSGRLVHGHLFLSSLFALAATLVRASNQAGQAGRHWDF
ncbi:MAG: hypothetical protein ACOVS5_10720, partial [Oligoflexus sp.]